MTGPSNRWRDPDWWNTVGVLTLFGVATYAVLTVAAETESFWVLGAGVVALFVGWEKLGRHGLKRGPRQEADTTTTIADPPPSSPLTTTPAERRHAAGRGLRPIALWTTLAWLMALVFMAVVGAYVQDGDLPALLWVPAIVAVIVLLGTPVVWLVVIYVSVRSWRIARASRARRVRQTAAAQDQPGRGHAERQRDAVTASKHRRE